jgi:hypothetical protein
MERNLFLADLIFQSFVLIGACFIIKYGTILDFIRTPLKKVKFFERLLSCSLCIGFHVGFWKAILSGPLSMEYVFSLALYSSAVCWVADHLVDVMQTYIYGRD